jgi:hypothetical protein
MMAISDLESYRGLGPVTGTEREKLWRQPIPEISPNDEVGAMLEALQRLGFVGCYEREEVGEEIRRAGEDIQENSGVIGGELTIWFPSKFTSVHWITAVSDNAIYGGGKKYPEADIEYPAWNTEASRTDALSQNPRTLPHIRVAVYSPDSGDYDPLLHFLDRPLGDDFPSREETQLDLFARERDRYQAEHNEFNMVPLSGEEVAILALKRRILGVEEMPLNSGVMRDAPRGAFVWDSYVPYVTSDGVDRTGNKVDVGRMRFGCSKASEPYCFEGIGISVGKVQ